MLIASSHERIEIHGRFRPYLSRISPGHDEVAMTNLYHAINWRDPVPGKANSKSRAND